MGWNGRTYYMVISAGAAIINRYPSYLSIINSEANYVLYECNEEGEPVRLICTDSAPISIHKLEEELNLLAMERNTLIDTLTKKEES